MTYQTLSVERAELLATVTLSRPEKLNALSGEMLRELTLAFQALLADPPRAVIVTGAGPKAFSAGVDIGELAAMSTAAAKVRADQGHALAALLESFPCPVIAAVNGFALGGGLELALACDFIYASDNAKFGQPEVSIGVIPGFGGTQRLAHLVGIGRARELIYTGEIINAERALAMGLVNGVVLQDQLLAKVQTLGEQIASKGPLAVAQAKRVMLRGVTGDITRSSELEAQAFAMLFGTEDQKEGMQAFVEKRKPEFHGR